MTVMNCPLCKKDIVVHSYDDYNGCENYYCNSCELEMDVDESGIVFWNMEWAPLIMSGTRDVLVEIYPRNSIDSYKHSVYSQEYSDPTPALVELRNKYLILL